MPGAPISRWTMSYFAAALAWLIAGLMLMAGGFGWPVVDVGAADTLVVVHILAIGWLGLLFGGALLQFVPVLAATHLRLPGLAAPALLLILGGLACLLGGFLSLGGHSDIDPGIFLLGSAFLAAGFACLGVSLATTLLAQPTLDISGKLVSLGLVALLVTVLLGSAFAAALSGAFDSTLLADLPSFAIPFHAASGLLGWMTVTAIAVSYRLFSMFMLAPEAGGKAGRVAALSALAFAILYTALAFAYGNPGFAVILGLAATGLAIAVAGFYLRDVLHMWRGRRRKALELNSLGSLLSLAFLLPGLVLLAIAQMVDSTVPFGPVGVYVLAMGWLSGLGLAQLYKIVPFLTWLEAYGAAMGKSPVPRVQDLVRESRARIWLLAYSIAIAAAAASLLFGMPAGFRAAAGCQLVAVLALIVEYARARLLHYPPELVRLPTGAVRPRLFCANTKQGVTR